MALSTSRAILAMKRSNQRLAGTIPTKHFNSPADIPTLLLESIKCHQNPSIVIKESFGHFS